MDKDGKAPIKIELIDPATGETYCKCTSWTVPEPGKTATYSGKCGKDDKEFWIRIKWIGQI